AVHLASPPPAFGHLAPVITPSGVFAFPRHPTTSRRVWSADIGYPGDFRYREFYRDAGFDLPESRIDALRLGNGMRRNTGIKRHRITGRSVLLDDKEPYDRHDAMVACRQHAQNFCDILEYEAVGPGPMPPGNRVITAPYDAELFGHWWFEGPDFIDAVARGLSERASTVRMRSMSDVIALGAEWQVAEPARSSWGRRGQAEVWLNEGNDWVWPRLHRAVRRVQYLVERSDPRSAVNARALRQMARSLCLAAASDWPFMITMGTTVAYAERRLRTHLAEVERLGEQLEGNAVLHRDLEVLEARDTLFPDLDPQWFAP
ncbi:MAG: 1,4-alpha-glucan branching protein domain-containing protein, partial [Myxococcota bacterium]